ncbi:hypothetical protein FH972_021530 [Carpinus fangiana]|uniref:Uncharacterized protein n=1 Tax=Carpinus fangiana TaxID=176857 RepID=A0A5N6KPK1_9ROSI|nr:hypothetical protein FH972_021530 [Carpinus fangiana]
MVQRWRIDEEQMRLAPAPPPHSLAKEHSLTIDPLQVEPQEKKKTPKGRAKKRISYTRRFVNVTMTGGKRKVSYRFYEGDNHGRGGPDLMASIPQHKTTNELARMLATHKTTFTSKESPDFTRPVCDIWHCGAAGTCLNLLSAILDGRGSCRFVLRVSAEGLGQMTNQENGGGKTRDIITLFKSSSQASTRAETILKQLSAQASATATGDQASDHSGQESLQRSEFDVEVTEADPTPDQLRTILDGNSGSISQFVRGASSVEEAVKLAKNFHRPTRLRRQSPRSSDCSTQTRNETVFGGNMELQSGPVVSIAVIEYTIPLDECLSSIASSRGTGRRSSALSSLDCGGRISSQKSRCDEIITMICTRLLRCARPIHLNISVDSRITDGVGGVLVFHVRLLADSPSLSNSDMSSPHSDGSNASSSPHVEVETTNAPYVPHYLAWFSTEGGLRDSREADSQTPMIVHSDREADIAEWTTTFRKKWPHICADIFMDETDPPFDLRWYFDHWDFHVHGGQFLFDVLHKLVEENRARLLKFCMSWSDENPFGPSACVQHSYSLDKLFHPTDIQKYGRGFLRRAMKHIIKVWQSCEDLQVKQQNEMQEKQSDKPHTTGQMQVAQDKSSNRQSSQTPQFPVRYQAARDHGWDRTFRGTGTQSGRGKVGRGSYPSPTRRNMSLMKNPAHQRIEGGTDFHSFPVYPQQNPPSSRYTSHQTHQPIYQGGNQISGPPMFPYVPQHQNLATFGQFLGSHGPSPGLMTNFSYPNPADLPYPGVPAMLPYDFNPGVLMSGSQFQTGYSSNVPFAPGVLLYPGHVQSLQGTNVFQDVSSASGSYGDAQRSSTSEQQPPPLRRQPRRMSSTVSSFTYGQHNRSHQNDQRRSSTGNQQEDLDCQADGLAFNEQHATIQGARRATISSGSRGRRDSQNSRVVDDRRGPDSLNSDRLDELWVQGNEVSQADVADFIQSKSPIVQQWLKNKISSYHPRSTFVEGKVKLRSNSEVQRLLLEQSFEPKKCFTLESGGKITIKIPKPPGSRAVALRRRNDEYSGQTNAPFKDHMSSAPSQSHRGTSAGNPFTKQDVRCDDYEQTNANGLDHLSRKTGQITSSVTGIATPGSKNEFVSLVPAARVSQPVVHLPTPAPKTWASIAAGQPSNLMTASRVLPENPVIKSDAALNLQTRNKPGSPSVLQTEELKHPKEIEPARTCVLARAIPFSETQEADSVKLDAQPEFWNPKSVIKGENFSDSSIPSTKKKQSKKNLKKGSSSLVDQNDTIGSLSASVETQPRPSASDSSPLRDLTVAHTQEEISTHSAAGAAPLSTELAYSPENLINPKQYLVEGQSHEVAADPHHIVSPVSPNAEDTNEPSASKSSIITAPSWQKDIDAVFSILKDYEGDEFKVAWTSEVSALHDKLKDAQARLVVAENPTGSVNGKKRTKLNKAKATASLNIKDLREEVAMLQSRMMTAAEARKKNTSYAFTNTVDDPTIERARSTLSALKTLSRMMPNPTEGERQRRTRELLTGDLLPSIWNPPKRSVEDFDMNWTDFRRSRIDPTMTAPWEARENKSTGAVLTDESLTLQSGYLSTPRTLNPHTISIPKSFEEPTYSQEEALESPIREESMNAIWERPASKAKRPLPLDESEDGHGGASANDEEASPEPEVSATTSTIVQRPQATWASIASRGASSSGMTSINKGKGRSVVTSREEASLRKVSSHTMNPENSSGAYTTGQDEDKGVDPWKVGPEGPWGSSGLGSSGKRVDPVNDDMRKGG